MAISSALSAALLAPTAAGDPLTDHRARVSQQIAQTKGDLDESTKQLSAAAARVEKTQAQLDGARAALAQTQRELAAAKVADSLMAAKLKQAQADLAAAKAAVVAGQQALDAQMAMAGNMIRDQYQQQTNLLPIAMLVGNSTADLETRLQWSTTMFDTTQAQIDRLTVLQRQLTAERARQADLEAGVALARQAAADSLAAQRVLERKAENQTAVVAGLLRQRRSEERAAAHAVAVDKARYSALNRERAAVEHRIAVRIAQAEAARRAAAARAARRAAAARWAAEHARRQTSSHHVSRTSSHPSTHQTTSHRASSGGSSAHHGFAFPVSGPITSPFGMRFHPILHVWKLHDGTDFGASCGTAIHAAYGGRVAERYYNAGYGNRLMIDHGYIDGRYVTTGYNHAIRYVVSVGQHVSKGQVIGYVGSTGFATGCHLHLMVWLNGHVVNPMTWF